MIGLEYIIIDEVEDYVFSLMYEIISKINLTNLEDDIFKIKVG